MKKLVINATEGGAHIKGTIHMPLAKAIQKYCTKTINKSKIKPLLTLASDGDKLISKVIPLLEDDIAVLNTIAMNSRRGLAASHGLKNLMGRSNYRSLLSKRKGKQFDHMLKNAKKEAGIDFVRTNHIFFENAISSLKRSKLKNVLTLAHKNFKYSETAHIEATKNPLVNVAIYGASRAIQSRQLKVKETLTHFLRNNKDALIRIERNALILRAAKMASMSLRESYKETLELLKKYDETKDDSLLVSSEIEPINLDDAEEYFKAGNWAHPLLDAEKILKDLDYGFETPEYLKAKEVHEIALVKRSLAIEKAKTYEAENANRESRLIQYNDLLKESKEIGRKESKFDEALKLLRKAAKLMPDMIEARWGIATALHHAGQIKRSLKEYQKLTKDFPDNRTFKFEYGQVLLRDEQIQEGLKVICEVMTGTDEFDNFLARLGEIYEHSNMIEEALVAYTSYLKKYPFDHKIWVKKGDCLSSLGRKTMADWAFKKAREISPDE